MTQRDTQAPSGLSPVTERLIASIRRHTESAAAVRRGICLLSAGELDQAAVAFATARRLGDATRSLGSLLAACLAAGGRYEAAARELASPDHEHHIDADQLNPDAPGHDRPNHAADIRRVLALWAAGRQEPALAALRECIRTDPECAELHFQLGTLLTAMDRHDEAELRFTQAININQHTEAMVSLALCCGLRGAPDEALPYLQRAQDLRPFDARIGLLLTRAVQAIRQQGKMVHVRPRMADHGELDRRGIDELSRVIEAEPDFADAFLSIPVGSVHEHVYAMLLETLNSALERQPEHAELHHHCGRVLDRLGRSEEAISENERAVSLRPKFTRALIELGKLYHKTDRNVDAARRLEQAVDAGAQYADVYCLLGTLYRDRGDNHRARSAFEQALRINGNYEDARSALAALNA